MKIKALSRIISITLLAAASAPALAVDLPPEFGWWHNDCNSCDAGWTGPAGLPLECVGNPDGILVWSWSYNGGPVATITMTCREAYPDEFP